MDPRLYTCAKTGNTYLLKQILNYNPTLILKLTPHGNTALHVSVLFGHKNIVAEILHRRPSLLTQPNLDGDTPLHTAARAGQFSVVYFLVMQMLNSSQGDVNGGIEMLRFENCDNNTALHEAVRNRRLEVVDLLLKVDPELACFINNAGESPLYLAARDGMVATVNRILMLPRFAHAGSDGQTALHAAMVEGHVEIIETLLRSVPQLAKETDHQGRSPLHVAAYLGDHRTVKHLLKLDTAIAYTLDKDGQSPIHVAASKGHTKVIQEIIQQCPDSGEVLGLSGQNALHVAILNGKVNVVRYMLETKELEGLINQADSHGNTPLHLATKGRKTWIVRYLIWDGRVDRRATNKSGETSIDVGESSREQYATFLKLQISSTRRQPSFPLTWINRKKLFQCANQDDEAAAAPMQTYKKMGHTLLMVATLIATVTFAAAFTMPGGYNNNVGPNQGLALLRDSRHFTFFIISDSIAMTCSITAMCLISYGAVIATKESYVYYFAGAMVLIYVALQATATTFITGIITVMPDKQFIRIMGYLIGMTFHTSTFLLLFQLVHIISLYEVFQWLVYRLCKLKSRFING